LSRIVRLFVRDRNELYHEYYGHLNNLEQPQMGENTVGELARNLKHKGLNWKQKMSGKSSKEYQDLLKIINEADIDDVKYDEANLKKQGYSDDIITTWGAFRESYDKALDLMTAQMKEMIKKIEEDAASKGIKAADFSDLYLTLKGALAQMGQYRGSYAPRLRQGNWAVTARRPQTQAREAEFEYYREHRFSHMAASRLRDKLKAEGWEIQNVSEVQKLPEDIYQDLKTISVAKAIEAAIDNMSKGQKGEAAQNQSIRFNEEILREVADMIKARGFRASMIRRTPGANVTKGYIEDPIERHALYTNNISRGLAKARVAQAAMQELMGTYIKGRHFGGIDPKTEAEVYTTAKDYIDEQLRNLDKTDRLIGWAKSLATLKFLGFSARAAVVNMTAIATTTPASIHQYVTEGRASFMKINRALVTAGNDSRKFMLGRDVGSGDDMRFLREEKRLGWDDPQYTRDMISKIGTTGNKTWAATMDVAMWMFGKTEQWNRLTTMLAAYRLARGDGKTHAEASELAKTASDKAHGIYGRATLPAFAWGRGGLAKVAQMLYVYTKFSHNYLHLLHDLGFRKNNWKAFTYTLLAPMIISGVSAWPLKDQTIMPLLGILFSVLGIKDKDEDFEKWMWDITRKYLGEAAEIAGRYGAMGVLGADISGSLSIGVGIPRNFWEWAGPIGGVAKEAFVLAPEEYKKGNYFRMAERLLPAGLANVVRAARESREGVTTQRGNRMWDVTGRPYRPTAGETALRVAGLRSSRQAAAAERLWEAKQQKSKFDDRRSAIYEHYRSYLVNKDPAEHKKIREKVREFNKSIRSAHVKGEVADITYEAMRRQVEKMRRADKRTRAMMR
ncbi:MAG: PLxRFG domain-containing protein, partial [Pseudomonadota bacterium]